MLSLRSFRSSWYQPICLLVCFYLLACSPSARFSSTRITPTAHTASKLSQGSTIYGEASYYADQFHGKITANGEVFDMNEISAAHKTLPFNTKLKVTNLENNRSVIVRVNDRGPYKKGRILDLSYRAAQEIGMLDTGVANVKITILELGDE